MKYKRRKYHILFLYVFLWCTFLSCNNKSKLPRYTASKADILGHWVVDVKAMKDEAWWNPKDRAVIAVIKNTEVDISESELKARVSLFGKSKEFTGKYVVEIVQGNIVKIKATQGIQSGKVWDIAFITKDQIRFTGLSDESQKKSDDSLDLIMKRMPTNTDANL